MSSSDTDNAWERDLHHQYRNTPHYESAHWDPRIWNYKVSIVIPTYRSVDMHVIICIIIEFGILDTCCSTP